MPAEDVEPFQPGDRVDHYTLVEQVGAGASGEVWQARDALRTVAIKFMNANLLRGETADKHRKRFYGEIKALERLLRVDGVPKLYGYSLYTRRPYLVMSYIDGTPWSQEIQSGAIMRLTLTQRLSLLDTVAETLTRIHQSGILHRDVKPSNIHGIDHPYLIDFSIATLKEHARYAEQGVGTAVYMPPPDGKAPDETADYFGFALVAYEVLFGQHALLNPSEMSDAFHRTRLLMQNKLENGTWHVPSQLGEAALPGSLRGADLEQLNVLFTLALRDRQLAPIELMHGLREAVITAENQPYLDYVPSAFNDAQGIPAEPEYTRHEVERARQHTQHDSDDDGTSSGRGWVQWSVVVLVMLWVIALALVFMTVLALRM